MVSHQPLIVIYAKLQQRHAETLAILEATNERNAAMVKLLEQVIQPYLESASLFEAHPCIRGDCGHPKDEYNAGFACVDSLKALIKENAETARKILAP